MKANIYVIECLTNLHAGNGETNFNIVDNEVERDVVTKFPTINASGVKGALREHFDGLIGNVFGDIKVDKDLIINIFGSEKDGSSQGKLKFLSADFIAQPRQAKSGDFVFELVAPRTAVDEFNHTLQNFGFPNETLSSEDANVFDLGTTPIKIIGDSEYDELELPVIARNQLKNGISKNLWYEEIVPHKSLFRFTVVSSNADTDSYLNIFDSVIKDQVVQFGGNASIGQGLTKIVKVYKQEGEQV